MEQRVQGWREEVHKLPLWEVQRVTPAPCSSRLPGSKADPGAGRPACTRKEDTSPGGPGCRSAPRTPSTEAASAAGGLGRRDRTGTGAAAAAAAAGRAGPVEAARAHAAQRSDARQAAATSDSTDAASGSGARRPAAHPRPTFPAPQRIGRGKAKFGSRR